MAVASVQADSRPAPRGDFEAAWKPLFLASKYTGDSGLSAIILRNESAAFEHDQRNEPQYNRIKC